MLPEILNEIFSFLDNANKIILFKILGTKNVTSEIIDDIVFDYFPTINGKGDYFNGGKKYKPLTNIKKISIDKDYCDINKKLLIFNQIHTVVIYNYEHEWSRCNVKKGYEIHVKNIIFKNKIGTIKYSISEKNENIEYDGQMFLNVHKNYDYQIKKIICDSIEFDGSFEYNFCIFPHLEVIKTIKYISAYPMFPKSLKKVSIKYDAHLKIIANDIISLKIKICNEQETDSIIKSNSLKKLYVDDFRMSYDVPNLEKLTTLRLDKS